MKLFFKELFDYSHHFNQELAKTFAGNTDKISENAVKLHSHILNAHQIWNNRIEPKQSPPFGVWELHSVKEFKSIDRANYQQTLQILDSFDLTDAIKYSNTKGQSFYNSIGDILFHIINHSTYHRAQIATDFKQSGREPLVTDYILYKR
jgi:uncharacterized damage-inducible protein DinB